MGWSSDEPEVTKKGMETSTKILLSIIGCVLLIIILIIAILLNIQYTTYTIIVDGKESTAKSKESLITTIDNITYINIEEFTKLVGYEYHEGEYKSFTISEGKCYVQGLNETATFYLDDNKICKLPVNQLEEDYREFTLENETKSLNGKMYAPIETINLAFNVVVKEEERLLEIYTLDYLVSQYNTKVKQWGYSDISEQSFENKKSILYGYLIVKKEDGLYKIIDNQNTREVVADKYTSIEFSENTEEFFVTNSLGQVGIINLDGTTKIEPIYKSISLLNKASGLYLVQKGEKFGVVKSGNIIVINPEYDSVGLNNNSTQTYILDNKYLILDTLIPVCKDDKWGAFDIEGNLIYNVEYDELGSTVTSVQIDGVEKKILPVLTIDRCKGIVVKKGDKYGLLNIEGKELVSVAVESIYAIEDEEDENSKYFMLYKGKELNIIERLLAAGLLEEPEEKVEEIDKSNTIENQITNTIVENTVATVSNLVANNQV